MGTVPNPGRGVAQDPVGFVPHRPPMLLLDGVRGTTDKTSHACLTVDPKAWYADPDGSMPAWYGIELMAQAVSAYSGGIKRSQNQKPSKGYLLGTRAYTSKLPAFPPGATLEIHCTQEYADDSGLWAFECSILLEGTPVATAMLKVFEEK
ncbi:MAG: beta-hydroxyacyl-ACP dehydratase [Holophagaceae bacterium]|nr:beta-hydroxyacyl-ACP dehydratase [Holophagaceae bacterium]